METFAQDTQGWLQIAVSIIKNAGLWIRHLAKQDGAERKKQSTQAFPLEKFSKTCSDSTATSPGNYYSCAEAELDDNGAFDRSEINVDRSFASTNVQDVSPGHNENHYAPCKRDGSKIEGCSGDDDDNDGALHRSQTDIDQNLTSTNVQDVSHDHKKNHDAARRIDGLKLQGHLDYDNLSEDDEYDDDDNWSDWSDDDDRSDLTSTNIQNVSHDHDENHNATRRSDGSKIEGLELIFCVANLIVELVSIVFDQLSSQHKAPFLLLCLIMSISAALISISELVYKLIKEMGIWKEVRSWQCWLDNTPSGVLVGFFPCIITLTCAFGQFIITTVNYCLYLKHGNAPIKISIWSTIFAFGQLVSLLSSRFAKTEITVNPDRQP